MAHLTLRDRARGALIGLAAGDALGTTLEFTGPLNPFMPQVTQIVGGGPFALPPGGWTDDTSMAICLAQSLVAMRDCVARDQMDRYLRWWQQGENSVLGHCFDIGNTTRDALYRYQTTGDPMAGDPNPNTAGNGSLMRMVPVVLAASHEAQAIAWAALQSCTTHAAPAAVDACRFYARLIWRAMAGASKDALTDPALGADLDLMPLVASIAQGSYRQKQPPAIRGTGYVVDALEAALWAFYTSESFVAGAILAVNLGQDADTTGAIYGQLAGAYYGLPAIPQDWQATVLWADTILALADALLELRGEIQS
ncbi:ADP-ribosylglycohydrolase family protein [Candidatus Viridilinea mediisalina]|uniref:ADP-ribosylglycohydrolase n=1 Tax=Candidatus Viridilinea mediisalina TaxID=2024553 RepID=A0A2A6RQ25_9CHLR|nr:ADP-ribosylglycohydrolase family protein [Candidatus Viridilinea mediisalina]PDW04970.1 ADP-ribosylglycohydrolase [Candidatus Viridilinea mediisalina]